MQPLWRTLTPLAVLCSAARCGPTLTPFASPPYPVLKHLHSKHAGCTLVACTLVLVLPALILLKEHVCCL